MIRVVREGSPEDPEGAALSPEQERVMLRHARALETAGCLPGLFYLCPPVRVGA